MFMIKWWQMSGARCISLTSSACLDKTLHCSYHTGFNQLVLLSPNNAIEIFVFSRPCDLHSIYIFAWHPQRPHDIGLSILTVLLCLSCCKTRTFLCKTVLHRLQARVKHIQLHIQIKMLSNFCTSFVRVN